MGEKMKKSVTRIEEDRRQGLTVWVVIYRKRVVGQFLARENAEKLADKIERWRS